MNFLSIKKLLITALGGLFLSITAGSQTVTTRYQMNPKVGQAIGKMRATQSNIELLQVLSAFQDRAEQATQVILASMNIFDLEQRNEILLMLFRLPRAEDGLNADHIPLLAQLYIKSVQSPPSPYLLPQHRTFIETEVLAFRLLPIIASLLRAEPPPVVFPPSEKLPRLLRLLEKVRGSSSLSTTDHKMVEDAIIVVKKAMEAEGMKGTASTPVTTLPKPSMKQSLATTKAHEVKTKVSISSEQPNLAVQSSIIAVLIMAACGLLWLLLKRHS